MSDYSSTSEVKALTRMYLSGESAFNSTTLPTGTEVETFIDRACSVLNIALSNEGFSVPVTNAVAKPACDQWVTLMAAQFVELSQPMTEWGEEGNTRADMMGGMAKDAVRFVRDNALGFKNIGVPTSDPVGQGVIFTGQEAQSLRADPLDTSLEQPKFRRGQFDA